jgi:hypothetical protein
VFLLGEENRKACSGSSDQTFVADQPLAWAAISPAERLFALAAFSQKCREYLNASF